jgi:hypothetical protein
MPEVVSYQANAKARHTATVSSFSNAFSRPSRPNDDQVKVPFFVLTIALKQATSHWRVNVVSIDISVSWSLWYFSTLSATET